MATKLFVGNLPRGTTDQSLRDFVTGAGIQTASVVVIRDRISGEARGFGFVELAAGENRERAIAGLNGQSLSGRTLTVNEARPQNAGPRRQKGMGGPDAFSRRRNY